MHVIECFLSQGLFLREILKFQLRSNQTVLKDRCSQTDPEEYAHTQLAEISYSLSF